MSLLFIYMLHLISCLFNLIAPKTCVICDNRVNHNDTFICEVCNLTLPRTNHILNPYDNNMAKTFWARFPIERAAALFYYETGSKVSRPIQLLKYFNRPDLGEELGRFIAHEFQEQDFFEGISYIIPVPLTKERLKKRGYN
ncbi:MAG: ComF family protein, partial [Prevotella nanceiensis]|nr:ComF family protein [Hoylesella nanceiensis]